MQSLRIQWSGVSCAMHAHKLQKSRPHLSPEETRPASHRHRKQRELERKAMAMYVIIARLCVLPGAMAAALYLCQELPYHPNM
ncbi:hypothetical protein OIU77_026254 [Salix suchowensis]|uniref:Uncharacterized protein n=1 Tax=Salix suchowensis TaxID=1278906 RepID=A0ABQ9BZU3_9ROSI|nr:hypothetical protein OIU77_026254 [Salix suchowensis]